MKKSFIINIVSCITLYLSFLLIAPTSIAEPASGGSTIADEYYEIPVDYDNSYWTIQLEKNDHFKRVPSSNLLWKLADH